MEKLKVTKLEAAKCQMDEAIRLFFERRDSIAIHTLAAAASQLLCDLCASKKGIAAPSRGAGIIREKRRREWLRAVKESENFFKHANRDPDAAHDFNVGQTEFVLFEAAYMYSVLTGRHTYHGFVFQSWFGLKYPHVLLESEFKRRLLEHAATVDLKPDDWKSFRALLAVRTRLPAKLQNMMD